MIRISLLSLFLSFGCVHSSKSFPISDESVEAGTKVQAGGAAVSLYNESGNIKVGKLIQPFVKELGSEAKFENKVVVINVVPSIDTAVCEEQSHKLSESNLLSSEVLRATISRDLPMAQSRFAKDAKLTNIVYLSDYKTGSFGKASGLLMHGSELLARAVIVVDRKGVIRHLQIVPNVATLPNLDRAFTIANTLVLEPR